MEFVFPAPVGMVRVVLIENRFQTGFPRARGDGPFDRDHDQQKCKFSPRPWGWSGHGIRGKLHGVVFPAPVGMVRLECRQSGSIHSFPRARGDGP